MFSRIVFIGLAALCALLVGACGGGSGASPVAVACTSPMLPSGAADSTFSVAAWADRDYDLVLPASYRCGTPISVAIVYHGGGGSKESMRKIACPGGDPTSADCLDISPPPPAASSSTSRWSARATTGRAATSTRATRCSAA